MSEHKASITRWIATAERAIGFGAEKVFGSNPPNHAQGRSEPCPIRVFCCDAPGFARPARPFSLFWLIYLSNSRSWHPGGARCYVNGARLSCDGPLRAECKAICSAIEVICE